VAALAFSRGAPVAFLAGYLPVLLLLPDYYRWILPGLPDPGFQHLAGMALLGIGLARREIVIRPSLTDAIVIGYVVVVGTSEYRAAGWSEAQNLLFDLVSAVPVPYFLAKGLIEPRGLRLAFARRLVLLVAFVAVASLYELKMGATPWPLLLDRFFPGQGQWVTTFRWGMARVAGPWGHAILAGTIFAVVYRIQRWLEWTGAWREAERRTGYPVGRMLTVAVGAGIGMALTRGPWLAAGVGAAVMLVARSKHRKQMAWGLVAATLLIGVPAFSAFLDYSSVGRAAAKSVAQESAAYRYEMVEHYVGKVEDGLWLGYGRNTWPKNPNFPSIDNHYLFLALTHGCVALALFLAIPIRQGARLLRLGVRRDAQDPTSILAFTFVSIFAIYLMAATSVFIGAQALPVLFLVAGWSEGLLLQPAEAPVATATAEAARPASRGLVTAGAGAGIRRVLV
jgi:hypothetical protein